MYVFIVTMAMTLVGRMVDASLLDGPGAACPVQPPCVCRENIIDCNHSDLVNFPNIYPFSTDAPKLIFDFEYNMITNMPSQAFENITAANTTQVAVHLNSNMISNIYNFAFSGIENETTYLGLKDNMLATLPTEIGRLTNLQILDLRNNPITNMDIEVLAHFQKTLKSLALSTGNMASWPDELHILWELQSVDVDHLPFRTIPKDAFRGFESTLNVLTLQYTEFDRIPESLCSLKHLHRFRFIHNSMLNGRADTYDLCHDPLIEVETVILEANNLSYFPDGLFTTFPNISHLFLQGNNIRFIPVQSVSANSLVTINLNSNQLSSIPYAINGFRMLQYLFIEGNQLIAVEHDALLGLNNLAHLNLRSNPLEYMDPGAFRSQVNSTTNIDLDDTLLDTVPDAVKVLQQLGVLSLATTAGIECSCDNLAHLRGWNVSRVTIYGKCELSVDSIEDFVLTSLPHCPMGDLVA